MSRIGPESDAVLRDLFQHYLRDMAEWFEVNPDGSYSYETSVIWEKGYDAYLARLGDCVAGFALIGSADKYLSEVGARDVHEFFVLRRFRRGGIGRQMAMRLWNMYRGEWLVRVLEANAPALAFWRATIAGFTLRSCSGPCKREGCLVKGRPWVYLRFTSAGCTAAPAPTPAL
jgi:predicted acetyltransferase